VHRRDEISVFVLVGASANFIRMPFILEGVTIGFLASLISLGLSFAIHSLLLSWLGEKLNFWLAFQQIPPLQLGYVVVNLITGMAFGALGSWNCVRKLNTGWAAVS
jgi:cell division transport system permease protein